MKPSRIVFVVLVSLYLCFIVNETQADDKPARNLNALIETVRKKEVKHKRTKARVKSSVRKSTAQDPELAILKTGIDVMYRDFDTVLAEIQDSMSTSDKALSIDGKAPDVDKFRDAAIPLLETAELMLEKKLAMKRSILGISSQYERLSEYYAQRLKVIKDSAKQIQDDARLDADGRESLINPLGSLEADLVKSVEAWKAKSRMASESVSEEMFERHFVLLEYEVKIIREVIKILDAVGEFGSGAEMLDKLNGYHERFQKFMDAIHQMHSDLRVPQDTL